MLEIPSEEEMEFIQLQEMQLAEEQLLHEQQIEDMPNDDDSDAESERMFHRCASSCEICIIPENFETWERFDPVELLKKEFEELTKHEKFALSYFRLHSFRIGCYPKLEYNSVQDLLISQWFLENNNLDGFQMMFIDKSDSIPMFEQLESVQVSERKDIFERWTDL